MSKIHDPNLTAYATDLANAVGMVASGQPWQDDASRPTAELLAEPHPLLAEHDADEDAEDPDFLEEVEVALPATKRALKKALDELGVDYPKNASKDELEALYLDAVVEA